MRFCWLAISTYNNISIFSKVNRGLRNEFGIVGYAPSPLNVMQMRGKAASKSYIVLGLVFSSFFFEVISRLFFVFHSRSQQRFN